VPQGTWHYLQAGNHRLVGHLIKICFTTVDWIINSTTSRERQRIENTKSPYVFLCAMHTQLPVLLEKLEILFPTGKKMESSEPEVGNSSSFFFYFPVVWTRNTQNWRCPKLNHIYVGNAATEYNLLICLWIFIASLRTNLKQRRSWSPRCNPWRRQK
jgi:hypothetical protein